MKKIFILLTILVLLIIPCISFASEEEPGYFYTNESGEFIYSDEFMYSGDEEYIDDADDYEDLYTDTSNYQEELKTEFDEQLKYFLDSSEREPLHKFVVVEISGDVKSEYTSDYYNIYLMKYQTIRVKDEEGNVQAGVVVLYSDMFETNNISPLKVGDTFYGYSYEISKDSEEYSFVDHGFTDDTVLLIQLVQQDRSLGIILLIIFAVLLLLLYAGKHGAKLLIPLFVIIDLLYVVFASLLEVGFNVYILAALIALELIILIAVLKNGATRKSLVAIISSIAVVSIVIIITLFFANTNGISGTDTLSPDYSLYDNSYYIANVINSKIDNKAFYIAIITIISSVVVATISSLLVELSEKYAGTKGMINSIIEEAKGKLSGYIMIISAIFLVNLLPTFMANLYNHSTPSLILDSETFVTELSIYLLVIISALIISPITAIFSNLLMGDVEVKEIEEKKK